MNREQRLIESVLQSVIIVCIWIIITRLLLSKVNSVWPILIIGILGGIYCVEYIKRPYKKQNLIVNSWILLVTVIFLGILVGKVINTSNLIGIAIGVSVFDVISFTKKGKKTLSAKVMGNKKTMSKFIVYGMSIKDKSPVPTKGLGDFFFYTVITSGIYKNFDPILAKFSFTMIFIGCLINYLIVCIIYKKPWYKGFPATPIPFILVLGMLMFCTL